MSSSSTVSSPPLLPPHIAGRKILPLPKRRLRSQSQPIRPLFDLSAFSTCEENSDSSSDEDSLNPGADWTDNTNNKKKRKIPTGSSFSSSSMYHNDDRSSLVHSCHPGIHKPRFKSAPVAYRQPKKYLETVLPALTAPDPNLTPPRGSFTFSCPAPGRHLPDYSTAQVQTIPRSNPHQTIIRRRRRRQQQRRLPPTREQQPEFWMCQFCEYTAIFGQPPIQLERLYDIKERRERHKILQRKRLAAKSRLKRRGGPNSSSSSSSAAPTAVIEAPSPRDGYREVGVQTDVRTSISRFKPKMKSSSTTTTNYTQIGSDNDPISVG